MRVIQDQTDVLAHWIYSREEWSAFIRWERGERGLFFYVLNRLFRRNPGPHQVTITGQDISINSDREIFANHERSLKRIHVKDAGSINVLEIMYEMKFNRPGRLNAIQIPVPKGKLREAIDVQESLAGHVVF